MEAHVRQFCSRHGLRLNTDLGQHFLIDAAVLDAIVDAADIRPEDRVVEIGPGIGVLTRELLQRARSVTVIEIDPRMIPLLRTFVTPDHEITNQRNNELTIVAGNALRVPFPSEPYTIVANIPYHITSPLLRHAFLEGSRPPSSLTLLIQREVAEKICDPRDAGLLTVVVGLFGTPRIVRHVPPSSFLPPPKVDSSVLHIDCFAEPKAGRETIEQVLRLVKVGFSQKRKMLRNTLAQLPDGPARLERGGIDPSRRPQTLSVDEWIALAAPL